MCVRAPRHWQFGLTASRLHDRPAIRANSRRQKPLAPRGRHTLINAPFAISSDTHNWSPPFGSSSVEYKTKHHLHTHTHTLATSNKKYAPAHVLYSLVAHMMIQLLACVCLRVRTRAPTTGICTQTTTTTYYWIFCARAATAAKPAQQAGSQAKCSSCNCLPVRRMRERARARA